MKHLLPCTCGRTIVVDTTQAGRQVMCECGLTVDVPALRGLRALPIVDASTSAGAYTVGPAQNDWSPMRGAMFSIGVLIALAAGTGAIYCWRAWMVLDVPPPTLAEMAANEEHFAKIPIDQMYDAYLFEKNRGLTNPLPPLYILARRARIVWGTSAIVASVVTLVGLALAGGSLISPRKRSSAKPAHNRQSS